MKQFMKFGCLYPTVGLFAFCVLIGILGATSGESPNRDHGGKAYQTASLPRITPTDRPVVASATSASSGTDKTVAVTETATPVPTTVCPTANRNSNLRSGPSTNYRIVGGARTGQCLDVVAINAAENWYKLESGKWIAAFLVDDAPAVLPVATNTSVPTATPQRVQNCDPSYPTICIPPHAPDLDCGEISHRRFQVLPPDPHRFDGDGDGIGCERDTSTFSPVPTSTPQPQAQNCDSAYPTICIPPHAPDLDCGEIPYRRFKVLPPDPHRFDGDHDGIGCER